MEAAVNSGEKQQGDRPPDSVPRHPKSRRVLARMALLVLAKGLGGLRAYGL